MQVLASRDLYRKFVSEFYNGCDKRPFASGIYKVFRNEKNEIIAVKFLFVGIEKDYGMMAVIMDILRINPSEFIKHDKNIFRIFTKEEKKAIFNGYLSSFKNLKNHPGVDNLLEEDVEIGGFVCPDITALSGDTDNIEEMHFRLRIANETEINKKGGKTIFLNLDFVYEMPYCIWFADLCLSLEQWLSHELGELVFPMEGILPPKIWYK